MEREKMITLRSLTQTMSARDLLMKNGIRSKIVRTPRGASEGGCSYSLAVPTDQYLKAKYLIGAAVRSGGGL